MARRTRNPETTSATDLYLLAVRSQQPKQEREISDSTR